MTQRLYQINPDLKTCTSKVVAITEDHCLVLDNSLFFPTGGGQPCDLGTINDIPLSEVFERDGEVYHRFSQPTPLKVGDSVTCSLDWPRRFDHMQRHCGEHILSGIFFRELGGVNKGFHMGIDYMTIDIDLPAISWDAACRIELAANEVIWSDAPVSVRIFKNRAEAERLPLRKAIAIDEDIAVVCVGDEENPADCVACCGTHPATAGQVGLIKLIRLESHKGMTRVYFDAGRRAFLLAVKEHQLITTLAEKYSADESTLLEKMQTQDEKNAGVRQSLQRYRELLIEKEQLALLEATSLPEDEPAGCPQVIVKEYDQLLIEDLNLLMKGITALSPNSFILISIEEKALLIGRAQNTGSQGLDCGGLIKANAPSFNGRGGGSQTNGRAAFQSLGDLDDFVTHIVGLILDEA